METDYSKHTHFRWKIKWQLEHLGALGIVGEMAPNPILNNTPYAWKWPLDFIHLDDYLCDGKMYEVTKNYNKWTLLTSNNECYALES